MKKMLCIIILIALTNTINAQIDENPVDSEANEATRELYHYLRNEVWGKKVISGCQAEWNYNINDAERIHEAGGKYPKINVFDFHLINRGSTTEPQQPNYGTKPAALSHSCGIYTCRPMPLSSKSLIGRGSTYIVKCHAISCLRGVPPKGRSKTTFSKGSWRGWQICCSIIRARVSPSYGDHFTKPQVDGSGGVPKTVKLTNNSIAICSTISVKQASTISSGYGHRKWVTTTGILAMNTWIS